MGDIKNQQFIEFRKKDENTSSSDYDSDISSDENEDNNEK